MKTNFFCNSTNLTRIVFLAAGLASACPLLAAVLSVDVNSAGLPGNTQDGFDALVAPSSSFANVSGTFNGVTITVAGVGEMLAAQTRAMPTNNLDTNSPALSTAALYQDFIAGGYTNGHGLSVLLSGLTPNQTYPIKIWSFDASSSGARVSDWTANGTLVANKFTFNGDDLPTDSQESAFSFTVAASSFGEILITGLHGASQGTGAAVFLNAIQVGAAIAANVPDPYTSSWFTAYSGKYARVYTNNAMKLAGTALTTWSNGSQNQSSPAYAGVQEIYSSASWLYIRSSGLASHIMGPWQNGAFPNLPANQKSFWRFPRINSVPTNKTLTGLGSIGFFVDGVAMFDTRDAFYWTGSTETQGNGYWNREAYVNEGATFDPGYAHQENTGTHHYHADPIALRYQLGDHVDFNSATDTYSESTNAVTKHSPILGWVADGYPVYGPYGFSSASNSASGIRRMISGYVLRNGQYGTSNLTANGRTTIPQWAVRLYNVASNVLSGPAVSTTYPLGRYMEDEDYLGDHGYTQGVEFDLDLYNGRWCVTPEFPNGTYAYFVSISSNGTPTFPYNIGRAYYGTPSGGSITTLSETVTTNFLGGPNIRGSLSRPAFSGNNVVLTWSAVEGGTYRVEAENSLSGSGWAAVATNIVSGSVTGTATDTNGGANAMRFYRVARTALASYDPVSGTGGGGNSSVVPGGSGSRGTTVNVTITLPNNPPWPPANAPISSVTLAGTINGTNISDATQGTVLCTFAIPSNAPTGAQTVVVTFSSPGPTYTFTGGFTIN